MMKRNAKYTCAAFLFFLLSSCTGKPQPVKDADEICEMGKKYGVMRKEAKQADDSVALAKAELYLREMNQKTLEIYSKYEYDRVSLDAFKDHLGDCENLSD